MREREKGEDVLLTRNDPWPTDSNRKIGALQANDRDQQVQEVGVLQANDRDRQIRMVVKLHAEHVRELKAKGEIVNISNTNVVNNVLVHNWGRVLREELGENTINVQNAEIRALQDVRVAGKVDNCLTPTDKIRYNVPFTQSSSPSDKSTFGGNINQLGLKDNNIGDNGGSPGDPNGIDSGIVNRRWGGRDDTDSGKKREFLLVKSSNININIFTGYNLQTNPYNPFNKATENL